jgi:hypothetical protein
LGKRREAWADVGKEGGTVLGLPFVFVVLWVGGWNNRRMIYRIREGLWLRASAVSPPAD